MKLENFKKGRLGEEIAINHLKEKGFEIIEKNWHTKWGEIDLIGLDKETLVFVEVKLKVGDRFGTPEEMINKFKLAQVTSTAEMFLLANQKYYSFKKRIDAVCIVLGEGGETEKIAHYENVNS